MLKQRFNIIVGSLLFLALASLPFLFMQQKNGLIVREPVVRQHIATAVSNLNGAVLGFTTDSEPLSVERTGEYRNPFSLPREPQVPLKQGAVTAASAEFDAMMAPVVAAQQVAVKVYPRGFTYPMAELGGCINRQSCFDYCQMAEHVNVCSQLAIANGLMSATSKSSVLGAAVDIPPSGYENSARSAASQVAGPTQYSFPSLDNYLQNLNQQQLRGPAPRVLAANIDSLPFDRVQECLNQLNEVGQDLDNFDDSGNPQLPANEEERERLQEELDSQQQRCQTVTEDYNEALQDNYQQQTQLGRENAVDSIFNLQQCLSQAKDPAADIAQCLQSPANQ